MPFSDLLDQIDAGSSKPIIIDRDVVPALLELTSQDKIYYVASDLDIEVSFGHFKRFRERSTPYAEPAWVTEVRYSKELNTCWKRFVCCKELMHAFDYEDELANTGEKFRRLLSELELRPPTPSRMLLSEHRALWRAMAVLAPARLIAPLEDDYKSGTLNDYEVALSLRIPEFYVPHIFDEIFPEIVGVLRNGG